MNGHEEFLTDIIEGKMTRFVIPVYQRNYDWKPEQCGRLFDDLVDVATTERTEHFFGSIVSQTPRGERVVIDGQQRITTIFLLLAALRKQLKDGVVTSQKDDLADDIDYGYLRDERHRKEQKLRLKLVKDDSAAFAALIDGHEEALVLESSVTQNYLYFLDRIKKMSITADELYEAIQVLRVIDIKLDEQDDAQMIFESLNSTGLDLSEADKVRNFILMNLPSDLQEEYYSDYWNVIEKNTDYKVSDFIRYYLAAKVSKTPVMKKVYPEFRKYVFKRYCDESKGAFGIKTRPLFEDMLTYSKHYRTCLHPDTGVEGLDRALRSLALFDASVLFPYLLNLLEYRQQGSLSDDTTAAVLWMLDSYLFRRWACSVPANALNKIFETLHGDVLRNMGDGENYSEVVSYLMTHKGGTGRFPDDDEFLAAIRTRDFYHIQNRKFYLYDRLENENKERVAVVTGLEEGTFSVEHVMPQTLNDEWKESLGPEWERIHDEWVNQIANLTLTAYNSDYSNRPFAQKRDMKDGFKESGFRLNRWISRQETWGSPQLLERRQIMEQKFLELWPAAVSSFVPKRTLPDEASLDSGVDFTGRRITSFTFMGVRYTVSQWNTMEQKVLELLLELEPAKIHSLVDGANYPASAFKSQETKGCSRIAQGVYVKTPPSTATKIDLLNNVFIICDLEPSELMFEMPIDVKEKK